MSSSFPDEGFTYPDPSLYHEPSLYHLAGPLGLSQPQQSTTTAAPSVSAAAPASAASAPPLAIDPALLALPGQAPTRFAGAPRLSVIGTIFPGFPAGLVPPIQINGEDAARYNGLVAGTIF